MMRTVDQKASSRFHKLIVREMREAEDQTVLLLLDTGYRMTEREEGRMRGDSKNQGDIFSYVMPMDRIPEDLPLRSIKKLVDAILKELSPDFDSLYAVGGRPSMELSFKRGRA